ncbi:MAG: hypothetical protein V1708_01800 [Candidatus Micrarchaeota archaeon]
MGKSGDALVSLSRLLPKIPYSQLRLFHGFRWPLEQELRPMSLLLGKKRRYSSPDRMFFGFQELPTFGKEYWFLYFCDPIRKRQFIATFGRGEGSVAINGNRLAAQHGKPDLCDLACVYWSLGGGVKRSGGFSSAFAAGMHENGIISDGKRVDFVGKYPSYQFLLHDKGRQVIDVELHARASGKPFELGHFSTSVFGFEMANLFLRFSGTLHGKPFSGECYAQKVVAVGPFVPWNWVRVYFADNSCLDYFSLRFSPSREWGSITPSNAVFFDAKRRSYRTFHGCKLERDNSRKSWVLLDKEDNLLLRLRTLRKHRFLFESTGEFRYDQHFVEAVDEETDGARLAGRPLGDGIGLLEDASGFML